MKEVWAPTSAADKTLKPVSGDCRSAGGEATLTKALLEVLKSDTTELERKRR